MGDKTERIMTCPWCGIWHTGPTVAPPNENWRIGMFTKKYMGKDPCKHGRTEVVAFVASRVVVNDD